MLQKIHMPNIGILLLIISKYFTKRKNVIFFQKTSQPLKCNDSGQVFRLKYKALNQKFTRRLRRRVGIPMSLKNTNISFPHRSLKYLIFPLAFHRFVLLLSVKEEKKVIY